MFLLNGFELLKELRKKEIYTQQYLTSLNQVNDIEKRF